MKSDIISDWPIFMLAHFILMEGLRAFGQQILLEGSQMLMAQVVQNGVSHTNRYQNILNLIPQSAILLTTKKLAFHMEEMKIDPASILRW